MERSNGTELHQSFLDLVSKLVSKGLELTIFVKHTAQGRKQWYKAAEESQVFAQYSGFRSMILVMVKGRQKLLILGTINKAQANI